MVRNSFFAITLFISIQVFAQQTPDGRTSAKFIYHPKLKSMLLVDGWQIHPESNKNPVWSWDGHGWKLIDAEGPASRSLSSGDLNRRTNTIVMYGGVGKTNYDDLMNDTWSFDGKTWTRLNTNDIGSRDHHQMVYADHLDGFVLYGGSTATRDFDSTTWILKDNRYTSLGIEGPGSRYHFGMAYDPNRKKVVLFGGGNKSRKILNDVWEFDGKVWQRITPEKEIHPRIWHSMVYNDELKMILVHGGKEVTDKGDDFTTETWGWNGKTWTLIGSKGPQAILVALGYDPLRKVTVAFGESPDNNAMTSSVWELKNGKWKKIADGNTWEWGDNKYVQKK